MKAESFLQAIRCLPPQTAAILRSLSKLAQLLPADTVCLTGHGDSTTMARELMQNPFMQM